VTHFIGSLKLTSTQDSGKFSRPTPNDSSGDALGDYFLPTTSSNVSEAEDNVSEAEDQKYAKYSESTEIPEDTEYKVTKGICYLRSDLLSPATYEEVCILLHYENLY
jgi:hypothetical protein